MLPKIKQYLKRLQDIEEKLKPGDKKFRRCLIEHYGVTANNTFEKIKNLVFKLKIAEAPLELETITKFANISYNNINSYIKFQLQNKVQFKFKTLVKISIALRRWKRKTMEDFDIKTAATLVQLYDGNADSLENFLGSANLLRKLFPKDTKQILVEFLKTRLTGKAQLGLAPNITDFETLIQDVKSRCQEKINPDKVIAELKSICHTDTKTLCDEVEILCTKLKVMYLKQNIPEQVANDMAVKRGIETLIDKVKLTETRIILQAGQYTSISDATEKALESERMHNSAQQVFAFRKNFSAPNRSFDNRYSNQYTRNTYNRSQNRGNFTSNWQTNNRHQHNNFHNTNNRRFFRNTNRNNNRIYTTQATEQEHFLEENPQHTDYQS
ncbi:uncharacterized protein LOC133391306 [Anopheles gambiae]|uniref:uncharacterized protein LOC133391306 n=1 Tax=Anopheles gambiae TaxID=7165 RepID=UPI002AC8FF8C|nr:uncharacterized protein LOC133391306 [Anopheles gambiae]